MKNWFKITVFAASLAILSTGIALADDMAAKATGNATPAASNPSTSLGHGPKAKAKTKKAKKKVAKEKYVWVCPMGDYTGDKPGKCPNCQMDLVKQKVTESKPAAEKTDKKM